MLTTRTEPVKQGVLLHGFVLFASERPMDEFKENVKRYRITCLDAFEGRHIIEAAAGTFPDIAFWQDLAGMKIIPKKAGAKE